MLIVPKYAEWSVAILDQRTPTAGGAPPKIAKRNQKNPNGRGTLAYPCHEARRREASAEGRGETQVASR